MYIFYNPNPKQKLVGDCVIRALSLALNMSWDDVYLDLCDYAYKIKDMPSANYVWGNYLKINGFTQRAVNAKNPVCINVRDFSNDYNIGIYVLCTGSHVVTTINGNWYDSWNSGDECVSYYFKKQI